MLNVNVIGKNKIKRVVKTCVNDSMSSLVTRPPLVVMAERPGS